MLSWLILSTDLTPMMLMVYTTWTPRLDYREPLLFHTTTLIPNSTTRHQRFLLSRAPKLPDHPDHPIAIPPVNLRAVAEDVAEEASVPKVVFYEVGMIQMVAAADVSVAVVVVEIGGEEALAAGVRVDHGQRATMGLLSGLNLRSTTHGCLVLRLHHLHRRKATLGQPPP